MIRQAGRQLQQLLLQYMQGEVRRDAFTTSMASNDALCLMLTCVAHGLSLDRSDRGCGYHQQQQQHRSRARGHTAAAASVRGQHETAVQSSLARCRASLILCAACVTHGSKLETHTIQHACRHGRQAMQLASHLAHLVLNGWKTTWQCVGIGFRLHITGIDHEPAFVDASGMSLSSHRRCVPSLTCLSGLMHMKQHGICHLWRLCCHDVRINSYIRVCRWLGSACQRQPTGDVLLPSDTQTHREYMLSSFTLSNGTPHTLCSAPRFGQSSDIAACCQCPADMHGICSYLLI
jgi:hypothetical protein